MSPVWTPRRKVVWIDANGYVWHLSAKPKMQVHWLIY